MGRQEDMTFALTYLPPDIAWLPLIGILDASYLLFGVRRSPAPVLLILPWRDLGFDGAVRRVQA